MRTCADVMLTTVVDEEATRLKGTWRAGRSTQRRRVLDSDLPEAVEFSPAPGNLRQVSKRPLESDGTVTGFGRD